MLCNKETVVKRSNAAYPAYGHELNVYIHIYVTKICIYIIYMHMYATLTGFKSTTLIKFKNDLPSAMQVHSPQVSFSHIFCRGVRWDYAIFSRQTSKKHSLPHCCRVEVANASPNDPPVLPLHSAQEQSSTGVRRPPNSNLSAGHLLLYSTGVDGPTYFPQN